MAEYIDKQKVLELMRYAWDENGWDTEYGWLRQHIADEPTADVRENAKGIITYTHFNEELWGQSAICSLCGCKWQIADGESDYNFCPNCGADMRGEA